MNLDNIKNRISEFDSQAGLDFCGGDEEFFAEVLQDFVDSDKGPLAKQNYQDKDWKNYEINVHALKSTSRMMGFPDLGDRFEGLQLAASEENVSYIDKHHSDVIGILEEYINILKEEL